MIKRLTTILAATLCAFAAAGASAQTIRFPEKPIHMVVAFAPGGLTDLIARIYANAMEKKLGQSVIVENRPGAGGAIGRDYVAKSAPDGYVLLTEGATLAGYPVFTKRPLVDVLKDFAPVAAMTEVQLLLATSGAMPFTSFQEFVAYTKANPGKLNYSTSGPGSVPLAIEGMKRKFDLNIERIDYKSSAESYRALLTNEVQLTITGVARSLDDIKAGKIKPLLMTGTTRNPRLPDTPPGSDFMPGLLFNSYQGLLAPAGTPRPVIDILNRVVADVSRDPAVVDALTRLEQMVVPSTPEAFGQRLAEDIKNWTEIARAAGLEQD